MYLSYLLKFFISNSLSHIRDVFWPILFSLPLALSSLCCLLGDDVSALELSYSVISVVTQDKPYMMYIIPRLVVCFVYNFAMWFQSSTSLLFF